MFKNGKKGDLTEEENPHELLRSRIRGQTPSREGAYPLLSSQWHDPGGNLQPQSPESPILLFTQRVNLGLYWPSEYSSMFSHAAHLDELWIRLLIQGGLSCP